MCQLRPIWEESWHAVKSQVGVSPPQGPHNGNPMEEVFGAGDGVHVSHALIHGFPDCTNGGDGVLR